MSVNPDVVAVDALVAYLRQRLPAKVTSLNAARAAVLTSALPGPYVVPVGDVQLRLAAGSHGAALESVILSTGTYTAAGMATYINNWPVAGLTASADSFERLVLTANTAPASGVPSVVIVGQDNGAANALFGWAEGGEHVETAALTAPSWRGVCDGWPLAAPDMGQGFWVVVGNRTAKPTHPGIRRDTYLVTMAVHVLRPWSATAPPHRTREAIASCVRAVRELVESDDGRYLGRQANGDVQLATIESVTIDGAAREFKDAAGILFDTAQLTLNVRVFQRPD